MILRNHLQLGLPRRVVVYYLFFCLAALCWLAVGVVLVTQSVISSRSENAVLSRIGQAAAAIEVDYVRHGAENFGDHISRLTADGRLAYCAIVSEEGQFLAHTSEDLVGKGAVPQRGTPMRWGNVEGVGFTDKRGRPMREYRVALKAKGQPIGTLHAGALEPGMWGTVRQSANLAPLAILAPLILIGTGAVVLSRQARPLALLEAELRRVSQLPIDKPTDPNPQKTHTAAALGWNRVVEDLQRARSTSGSEDAGAKLASLSQSNQSSADNIIWQQLPDGIATADPSGKIIRANCAMAALLGSGGDAASLEDANILHSLPVHDAQTDQSGLESLSDPAHLQRPVVCELSVGAAQTLRVARQPLRQQGGELQGHMWTVRDVTQQKLAEQMRDQFIDAATHELRTPLANIKAYAETLASMDEPDLESQKEFCNTINSEATRLARFVDDLLSISSMEAGSLSLDRQNVDTKRLLDEVVEKVRPLTRSKSLEFDVQLPAKMPELNLDKDKIIAMLVNLLGNAVKYTPSGGRVGLKVKVADKLLQIDVDDTGVGIPADDVAKVFDKFFRGNDPRVLEETGTGLGLSLAREVVRLHGGDIHVTSEIDKGSTFSVMLPIREG